MDEKELLFKERVRLEELSKKLKSEQKVLELQKEKLAGEQKVFEQQCKVLETGFLKLAADKEMFQAEMKRQIQMDNQKKRGSSEFRFVSGPGFFGGTTSENSIKKRYKELMKIFHPDNRHGDSFTASCITKEYEIRIEEIKKDRS